MTTYIVEELGGGVATYLRREAAICCAETWKTRGISCRVIEVDADAGTAKIIAEFAPEKWEKRWLNAYLGGPIISHEDYRVAKANCSVEGKTIPVEIDFARGKIRQVEE